MRTIGCGVASLLLMTQVAFGQAGEPAAPKPAPELAQLSSMIGSWKCDGKMLMGGQEMKQKSTATFTWDLDKFFIAAKFDSPKSKENPNGFKGRAFYGYDVGTKQFVTMSADNMGGMGLMMSRGFDGDRMEWAGKVKLMGSEMDSKEIVTKKGDKETIISGTMGTGPQAMSWEMTCKK